MTTLALGSIQARPLPLNWRRISALSGSFTAHIALVLVLLIPPVALEVKRIVQKTSDPPPIIAKILDEDAKEVPLPVPPAFVKKKVPISHPTPVVSMEKPTPLPRDTQVTATDSPVLADAGDHAAAPPSQEIGDIGGGDAGPHALEYGTVTKIPYPRIALINREQGTVTLRVLVGVDGNPQQVEIDHSSGSRALDIAARDAVRRWKFKAGMRGGVAYAAWAIVPVNFTLP